MVKKYDCWRNPATLEWLEPQLWLEISPLDHLDHAITDGNALIEAFLPIGGVRYDIFYLSHRALLREYFFQLSLFEPTEIVVSY
jgi:hypothetical protein